MLQPVGDAEILEVAALLNRAYRGDASGWSAGTAYLTGDRTTPELLRADLAAKPAAQLLKWADEPGEGRIEGCVWLERLGGGAWYIGSLAIDPDRQNGGRGRVLLEAAEDWVREREGRSVRMTVINVREALIA